jgi:hypothetical protein
MMAQALAPVRRADGVPRAVDRRVLGTPTWGTYWAWDARMTSTLILLFLYFGVIALRNAIDDPRRADRAVRGADAGRRDQRADHLLLGALVEHAAPGRVGQHGGRRWRRRC